jgi:hypothetical protein
MQPPYVVHTWADRRAHGGFIVLLYVICSSAVVAVASEEQLVAAAEAKRDLEATLVSPPVVRTAAAMHWRTFNELPSSSLRCNSTPSS